MADARLRGNITKYYLGALLGGFAFFYNAVETLYYRSFDLSFAQIGTLISVTLIATILLEVPSGAFADIYGKKRTLVIAATTRFIGTACVTFSSSFTLFLAGFIFWGIGSAFSSGAASALLFDSLKAMGKQNLFIQHTGRVKSLFISVDIISGGLGPLLFAANIRLPYFISLGAAFLVILVQLSLYEPLKSEGSFHHIISHNLRQMREGFRYTFNSRVMIWLTAFNIMMIGAGRGFAELISQPFIINEAQFTLAQFAFIGAAGSIIQSVFVYFTDRLESRLGTRQAFWMIIITLPMLLIAFNSSRSLPLTAFLFGAFFAIWSFGEVVIENAMNHTIPDEQRATVLSISSLLVSLTVLTILPVIGILVDTLTLSQSLLALSAIYLMCGVLLINHTPNK